MGGQPCPDLGKVPFGSAPSSPQALVVHARAAVPTFKLPLTETRTGSPRVKRALEPLHLGQAKGLGPARNKELSPPKKLGSLGREKDPGALWLWNEKSGMSGSGVK